MANPDYNVCLNFLILSSFLLSLAMFGAIQILKSKFKSCNDAGKKCSIFEKQPQNESDVLDWYATKRKPLKETTSSP